MFNGSRTEKYTSDKIISMHEMLKWKYAIYRCPLVRIVVKYVSSPTGQAASIAKTCTMHVRAELRHQQHAAEHFTGIIKAEHFITI